MQDRAAARPAAGTPPVWVVALIIVVFVAFVGWLAYRNFAPPSNHASAQPANDWLGVLAKQSGGDYNKLSVADRQMLDARTQGKGAQYLKLKFDEMK